MLSRIIHIDHAMLDRRNKVSQAYDMWAEKNPTLSATDFITRFEEQQVCVYCGETVILRFFFFLNHFLNQTIIPQVSGPDMKGYLQDLGAFPDEEEIIEIDADDDDVYVL